MTTVAITGHRPERIKDWEQAKDALIEAYDTLEASLVIQGMAAGIDILAAKVAHRKNIPFWCARPWAGHMPRKCDVEDYNKAIRYAEKTIAVVDSQSYPGAWAYEKRNQWMIDNAEVVFAYWDGERKGGTFNAVRYANETGKSIYFFDPSAGYSEWIYPDETV